MNAHHTSSSSKPRLLVISSTYPRWKGDTEPGFVHTLCKHLSPKFNILVICPHAPGAFNKEHFEGVEVHRFRYGPTALETLCPDGGILSNLKRSPWKWMMVPLFLFGLLWASFRAVRKFRPHVIHCHWLIPQGIALWILSWFTKLPPILITSHGGDLFSFPGRIGQWAKRRAIKNASSVAIVSEPMREMAIRLGADSSRLNVAPMGIGFPLRSEDCTVSPRVSGRILFVGRLVEKKGLPHLIAALPRIIDAFPKAHLVIAGDGPERCALNRQTERLGLSDRIHFLGAVPHEQLPELYRTASLFCAPFIKARSGDMEGLGLVTLEAIYFECPVIVGNVPAVADVISSDLYSNCVVDPTNHSQLAESVISALTTPPPHSQISRLRRHSIEQFSWNNVSERYNALLRELIPRSEIVS